MDETTKIIRDFYNSDVVSEWERIANRPEFLITCRFIDRYVKPGDKVLDIGGGPGRYSLYLSDKGCDVTLFDLSDENVRFAMERAKDQNLKIEGVVGDARTVDESFRHSFDHILLMGPMYHLLEEADRVKAVNAALKLLKPGGTLFISFINIFAGIIYIMKYAPEAISDPLEREFHNTFIENRSFSGKAFTQAYFARQDEILPFMEKFPVEKLHFIGQESISSPCEGNIMSQSKEVIDLWMDLCERVCEREDLLSWSEHLMYIGRKVT
ncbi:2-polyprenyl-3-methyl-5-hydroxy-6-metoxy-1,4-benzoquinol methylase [Anaerotaenia torta]|uniref:class I SAM-dependent methyltransferase n=1 Tax=Anaerotaenia torta TaxID=433293 RepID=UPI003D1C4B30